MSEDLRPKPLIALVLVLFMLIVFFEGFTTAYRKPIVENLPEGWAVTEDVDMGGVYGDRGLVQYEGHGNVIEVWYMQAPLSLKLNQETGLFAHSTGMLIAQLEKEGKFEPDKTGEMNLAGHFCGYAEKVYDGRKKLEVTTVSGNLYLDMYADHALEDVDEREVLLIMTMTAGMK